MNDNSTELFARRRSHSGRGRIAVIAVAVLAVAGAGTYFLLDTGPKEDEYLYAPVEIGSIEDLVTATGTLQPRDYVDVGAQTSGQIEQIYVEVGDVVKAGDKLVEIDAETARARMEANEASLASSKNNLLTQRANLEKAERDLKRLENLFAADAATEEQVLNARTTFANAQRQVTSSELQIQQQEANMRIEKKNLAFTTITAPIDGTVMSIAVKVGQSVNASQNVPNVLRIANLNTMTVNSEVSEADVNKVEKGMQVYFTTLGAGSDRRWYGTVKRVEPTPKTQNSVVLYPVLFDVENDGSSLKPNATAQVFFVAAEARNVLTVPMSALQMGQQIAREMRMKEREAAQAAGGAEGGPAGAGPDAAAPGAAPAAMANAGSAPAAAQGAAGAGPEAAPGNRQGGGMRQGGGFGGGGPGGFGGGQFTPEQIEEMRARARERGAGGGPGGFGGGQGGFGPGGFGGGMAANSGRQQQRRGTVMVKLADGTLEARQVVIGVTDRVRGQVVEGLEEGEEVVIGRHETEAAAATPSTNTNNNQNFRPQDFRGNFGGGGRPF